MKTKDILITDNDFFSSSLNDEILVLRHKQHILSLTQDLNDIFSLYDYMDSILRSKSFKAFVMLAYSEQSARLEYTRFLAKILSANPNSVELLRFFNVVNRFIVTLSTLNCVTVFAGQGTISTFYLNIGLTHDYRIVADETVFENFNVDIGLVTKGSGYFLPRLLGIRKAAEVLQWESFSAEDALQVGLVDRIVPASQLEQETMQFIRKALVHSSSTLLGIRKLIKCDIEELKHSLDLEDHLIKERLNSVEFREMFAAHKSSSQRLPRQLHDKEGRSGSRNAARKNTTG